MSQGWIKLHRQLLDWEWYDDINVMRLFLHCLLRVNHKPKKWRGIDIERGQFYTSLDSLCEETGLTAQQLRTCFSKLKSTGEITSSGMARGRMVTVVQFELYQDDNKLDNRVATGSQQGSNRVATTNKNVKKDNNDKEVKPLVVKFSTDHMEFAKGMFSLIVKVAERTKEPDFNKWADVIRLMNENDKLELSEMANVFRWANKDLFWNTNILSPAKFRLKYSVLHSKMNSEKNGEANAAYKPVSKTHSQRQHEQAQQVLEAMEREHRESDSGLIC